MNYLLRENQTIVTVIIHTYSCIFNYRCETCATSILFQWRISNIIIAEINRQYTIVLSRRKSFKFKLCKLNEANTKIELFTV